MKKLVITQDDIKFRDMSCSPLQIGEAVSKKEVIANTSYFMYHQLGLKPYLWQSIFFRGLDNNSKNNIVCCCRQYLGKTTALATYALKSAFYNTRGSSFTNGKTRVGIISATEEQAKKVIEDIKELIFRGDERVSRLTGGKIKNFFSSQIDTTKNTLNNKSVISFLNGSKILCLPPTNRVRGYTFNVLLIDEASFIDDDNFFFDIALPTISKTNGQLILASTPNGQKGFFYKLFDFRDEGTSGDFNRLWVDYTYIENPDEMEKVLAIKDLYLSTGRERRWLQEFEAEFVSEQSAFFDNNDIEAGVDTSLSKVSEYKGFCDMGIDFGGMGNSDTCIVISTIENGVIKMLYHHIYPKGKETDLLSDVEYLTKKFNISRIIPDDCPEGFMFIQEIKSKGYNVKPMSFRTDKIRKYIQFRAFLRARKIKYYKIERLLMEMRGLEEIESVKQTIIRKSSSTTDDLIDAFVMSCYYYLDNEGVMKVFSLDTLEEKQVLNKDGESIFDKIRKKKDFVWW